MPSGEKHIEQVNRNKALLSVDILNPSLTVHPEWTITIMFYIAIHLVESKLAKIQYNSIDHADREKVMFNNPHLKEIFNDYMALKAASVGARYLCLYRTIDDAKRYMDCLQKIERKLH